MGRLLGIDVGEKRVGLALSDELHITVSAYKTLINDEAIKENIKHIVEENAVEKIIVGLPRNMDGSLGFQAEEVGRFVKENIEGMLEYEYEDETLTSCEADDVLKVKGHDGESRKSLVDSHAAKVILQSYITREE